MGVGNPPPIITENNSLCISVTINKNTKYFSGFENSPFSSLKQKQKFVNIFIGKGYIGI